MTRNTHDRELDHHGTELASHVVLDSSTATYGAGDDLMTIIDDLDGGGGGGGGGPEDLITGNDSTFLASLGAWTNSGGTLTRDTGVKVDGQVASLKFVTTSAGQYVELAIAGTFRAGQQYWVTFFVRGDLSTSKILDAYFGLIGTDEAQLSGGGNRTVFIGAQDDFALSSLPWTPSADRTGVKLRLAAHSTSPTQTFYLGLVQCFLSITAPIITTYPNSTYTRINLPMTVGGVVSLTGTPNGDGPSVTISRNGQVEMDVDGFITGVSVSTGYLYEWREHTPGDLAGDGWNLEVGDDYVGLYISEKDSNTVQIYADFASYDIELRDRTGKWKINDGTTIAPLANLTHIYVGTADPSAGGGVAHNMPAMYLRDNSNVTELWLATGTGATAWTKQTSP